MIEEGTYTAHAVQWDWGFAGTDKKRQIAVQFEILEGPYAGYTITWFGFFTEKTMQRTIESLRYCGWQDDDIIKMEGMGTLQVQIVVGHEEWEGKPRAKVRWVNRLGGGTIKLESPMDMAQKRLFAAEMRMHAKQVPPIKGGIAAPNRAKTEVPHGDPQENDPF
jgi:hypothetical protein